MDFCSAFDSIKWSAIWSSLENRGISRKYIDIFKELYKNSRAKVRTGVGLTNFFPIMKVAKQGD